MNIDIPPEIVATHDGRFHTDEVFAIAIIKKIYPNIIVWRTRDPDNQAQADLRVDTGRKNDPATGDFDHHQKEGAGIRENGIPYASAGLVWKHFGPKLVDNDYVWEKIDTILIQPIDALDNGVEIYEKKDPILPFAVNNITAGFYPSWDDEEGSYDAAFMRCVDFATTILENVISQWSSQFRARTVVEDAIAKQGNKKYIVLEKTCPYMDVVKDHKDILYVVFPNSSGKWSAWAGRDDPMSFANRIEYPASWGGLENEELVKVTGVEDALFCHRALFMASAKTREAMIELVEKSIAASGK